jgi:transcriptional regulator with XRE-family HTH domain
MSRLRRIVAGMMINGEQIKEERERLHMTQQELADKLDVSLRTIGSWERGESVPRSRMGAIREVLNMEDKDNRSALSRLINEQLQADGVGSDSLVRKLPGVTERTVYLWLSSSTVPLPRSRAALEDALGWKRGSVTRILEAPITEDVTLSEVKDWGAGTTDDISVKRASDLSDDELLVELTRRWGSMRARLDEFERIVGASPAKTRQDMFGLAAHSVDAGMNMEHLEDGV